MLVFEERGKPEYPEKNEPGTHWWEASALTTVPTLLPCSGGEMNFLFEWQEQYLTSKRSEQVRYCSCHENKIHIFELTCNVLFIGHADDDFLMLMTIFWRFSEHYWPLSEDIPKLFRKPGERFRTFLMVTEEGPRCFDHTSTNFTVVKGTKEKCHQTWYLHMRGYIVFISLLPLGIHWLLRYGGLNELKRRKGFTLKTHEMFCEHHCGEIWKHNIRWSFWISVWRRLGWGNHMIFVTPSFLRSHVFKICSVHTKSKSR